jgi:hypothetical protein
MMKISWRLRRRHEGRRMNRSSEVDADKDRQGQRRKKLRTESGVAAKLMINARQAREGGESLDDQQYSTKLWSRDQPGGAEWNDSTVDEAESVVRLSMRTGDTVMLIAINRRREHSGVLNALFVVAGLSSPRRATKLVDGLAG